MPLILKLFCNGVLGFISAMFLGSVVVFRDCRESFPCLKVIFF